jgi:hypothetical protein
MPGIEHGYERGIQTVVGALIIGVIVGRVVPTLIDAGFSHLAYSPASWSYQFSLPL